MVYSIGSVIGSVVLNITMGLSFFAIFYWRVLPRLASSRGEHGPSQFKNAIRTSLESAGTLAPRLSMGAKGLQQVLGETFLSTQSSEKINQHECETVRFYRHFQEALYYVSLTVCLLEVGLIFPSNWAATSFEQSYNSHNIPKGSPYFWAHAVTFMVVSVVFAVVVVRSDMQLRALLAARRRASPAKNSILLYNLPKLMDISAVEAHFQETMPGAVQCVEPNPDLNRLEKLHQQYLRVSNGLEQAVLVAESDGVAVQDLEHGCCAKASPFELLLAQADELEQQIQQQIDAPTESTGTAFVTFEAPQDMAAALRAFPLKGPVAAEKRSWDPRSWGAIRACPPNQVVWKHLKEFDAGSRLAVRLGGNFVCLMLVILIAAPWNGIAAAISVVLPHVLELLSSFIPTMLLSLFVWILIPLFIQMLVAAERNLNTSKNETTYLTLYSVYLLLVVIVLPPFGQVGWKLLQKLVQDPSDAFHQVYEDKSQFSMLLLFMSSFVFVTVPLSLLQAVEFVTVLGLRAFRCMCCCPHLSAQTYTANKGSTRQLMTAEFDFQQAYAEVLHIWSIGFIFSGACPILSLFSLLFVVVRRGVDRWQFIVQPTTERGNPAALVRVAIRFMKAYLVIHAGYVLLLLAVKDATGPLVLTSIVFVATAVACVVLPPYWRRFYAEPSSSSAALELTVFDVGVPVYRHPLSELKARGLHVKVTETFGPKEIVLQVRKTEDVCAVSEKDIQPGDYVEMPEIAQKTDSGRASNIGGF